MTNKPKFGAGSMSGEEVESQSEVKKEDTVETATDVYQDLIDITNGATPVQFKYIGIRK